MSNTGLHHLTARRVHSDLSPLGIKIVQGPANAVYQMRGGRLWKEIGTTYVFDTGRITVSHVADATPSEVALLAGHAEDVWRGTIVPTKATAWTFKRRNDKPNFWFTVLLVPADAMHDEAAARIEAASIPTSLAKMLSDATWNAVERDANAGELR